MTRMRRFPVVLMVIGGVLVVAAVVWRIVAVPALVKFPTDTDVTLRYEGTMTLFVDPATASPLAVPTQVPLTVERHIQADGDQSTSSAVLVNETIVEKAGSLVDTTQRNAYVMDRRTMENLVDSRSYAFDPANVVNRSPAYRINLPFNVSTTESYSIYKNEIGTTYQMQSNTAQPTGEEAGLQVNNYTASVAEQPLTDAYLAELDKSVPLPRSLTLDQLKPQLLQYRVDVDALLPAISPVLTPQDLAALAPIASQSIPLHYVLSLEGKAAVEPTTGVQLHVTDTETIGVRPELTTLPQLREILGHYPNVPEAVAANEGLGKLSTASATKLFELRYDQTPVSVSDVAATVSSQRNKITAVTWYVPAALLVLGLVALAVGAVLFWRRGKTETIDLREPTPRPSAVEGPSAPAGVASPSDGQGRTPAPHHADP